MVEFSVAGAGRFGMFSNSLVAKPTTVPMTQKEEDRFAKLARKQGFKTLSPAEMGELKALAEKKAKETKKIRTPRRKER
jgi:hypothetical protein